MINVAVAKEYVKTLVDRLTDDQLQALAGILELLTAEGKERPETIREIQMFALKAFQTGLPAEKVTPEEAAEIEEGFAEIDAGKGVKAADVWRTLGI